MLSSSVWVTVNVWSKRNSEWKSCFVVLLVFIVTHFKYDNRLFLFSMITQILPGLKKKKKNSGCKLF